ncbi:MAG: corrinoid protein [Thermoanaerobaculales bacterium]|nr:corrinoid protein [Thermoanaerobaculales bacterium]
MDDLERIGESLQRGDHHAVAELTAAAIAAGVPAIEILERGLLAGMDVVGRRFGAHEIFLPEVLLAARAMKAGMDLVKPRLVSGAAPSRGTVVLGTVKGDVHDIGKNLVGIMLEGAGYEVVDLGTGVAADAFVETAIAREASVIGLSALLTTTMGGMREVVDRLRERDPERRIKVIVGGAPLTQAFADSIGADGYSWDAAGAVELVRRLLEAA